MRSPRPGFLLSFAVRLLLCLTVAISGFSTPARAQNFAQPTVVKTGNWPAAIYAADVNGDGSPDLIYIDQGATPGQPSTTHILLNDGHGNFTASGAVATIGTSLAISDMDGNGTADLVWVTTAPPPPGFALSSIGSFTAFVAFGNGNGTFAAPAPYGTPIVLTTANPPLSTFVLDHVAVGHFYQKTGALDIVAEETTRNILCKFAGSSNLSQGAYLPGPGPIQVADLNNDGYDDLILQQSNTNILTLLGGPNFKYSTAPYSFAGLTGIRSVLVRDVNLDGVPDLIAEGANGHIDVYAGNGDGTFQTTSSGGTGTLNGLTGNGGHLIAIADLNHDGLSDALTATPIGISALLGQGTQYLGLKGIYNAGPGHTSYVTADFNGDGNLDLAVDSPEGIAILYGNSDGSFQTSQAFAAGQPAMSGALGNFTTINHLDAVVSTGSAQAQVLLGNGTGTFVAYGGATSPIPTTPQNGTPGLWSAVKTGLFYADGSLLDDLAITADGGSSAANGGVLIPLTSASAPSGLIVQKNNGGGTFSPPVSITGQPGVQQTANSPASFYGVSVAASNNNYIYTRDASAYRYTGDFGYTPNLSSSIFGTQTTYTNHPHNLIAFAQDTLSGATLVAQQEGHLFVFDTDLLTGSPLLGDLAVDGSLTTPGQLLPPDISSTFPGFSNALGFRAFPGSAVIADLSGANYGNADLIVAYDNLDADRTAPTAANPNYLYIWYGSGYGKFLTSAAHPVNPVRIQLSRNYYQVAVADMNGDGIPDLILSDGYVVAVQLGKGDGTFGAETHYLGGQGINTISVADVNNDGRLDLVLANGGAVLTNPVANLEALATNPDVNTGGITVLLNQATPAGLVSIGTVTASPEPTTYGEAFSLTATVSSPLSGTAPTGTVAFSIDSNAIGSANLIGTTATISSPQSVYSTLTVGTHTLTAVYSGDGNFTQKTFTGTHTVSLIPTTIGLALCVDPPGSNFPCGVNFPNVAPPLISPITMYFGQSIDGLATESAGNLTGQIVFYNGAAVFCTLNANLQQGGMACPAASGFFPVGNTIVTVDYTGDSTHAASMSNGVQVIVSPDITTATVTSSQNPSPLGQSVTFTAKVAGNYATPFGTVSFMDGTITLSMATLDSTGGATFTTSSLAVGTHPITVVYNGNPDFNPVTSAVLNQLITGGPTTFTLTVTPTPVVVEIGRDAVLQVTVTATGGFAEPVQLSCPLVPEEATCVFTEPLIPAGGGVSTLYFSPRAPHDCGSDTSYGADLGSHPIPATAGVVLGCLAMLPLYRRRRLLTRTILISLVTLCGLAALSGCGHCTDLGTRPGSYTFTVMGTAQGSTPLTASQTSTVTVTTVP